MKKSILLFVVAVLVVGMLSAGAFASNARVVRVGGAQSGACNRETWTFDLSVTAEVAQWVDWAVDYSGWNWQVLKPGVYEADCIEFKIASNGNVVVSFEELFDKLTRVDLDGYPDGVLQDMYARIGYLEEGSCDPINWIDDLEGQTLSLDDSNELHEGRYFKLWNKIKVEHCHSVGRYEASGKVTITIGNLQPWLDSDGNWNLN